MNIVVVGAGAVGISIAKELVGNDHEVTLIDWSPEAIRVAEVPEADWTLADACSPSALEEAGVRSSDAIVAATGDDKVNLIVSLLAKTEFAVPKVVARVNDPGNEWMFTSNWGVDVPTSTPRVMAALVEESVTVGMAVRLFSIGNASVVIYTFVVPPASPMLGTDAVAVHWPQGLFLSAVVRDGQAYTPSEISDLRTDDELLLLVGADDTEQVVILERMFAPVEGDAAEY